MQLKLSIAAAFLSCLVAFSTGVLAEDDPMDVYDHAETPAPLPDEFKAEFQVNLEDMFVLTAADEAKGAGLKSKLLNNLKAMMGKEVDGEDTGTQPDTDLTERRSAFTKNGWKGYMDFVKRGQLFLKKVSKQYEMGNGLIIMSGTLDEGKQRYWLGPEDKDKIVFTGKGHFICRAMESVMCDSKFRIHIAYGPQDAETFADVVITDWLVEFLNEKDRPIKKD